MKRPLWVAVLLLSVFVLMNPIYAKTSLTNLTCEYKTNPVGIDAENPRMGWIIESSDRGYMQSAYQVQVAKDKKSFKNPVWDSGKIKSDESIHVVYDGPALESGTRYYWRAKVWDAKDKSTSWSDEAYWEMGLLNTADWKAEWIHPTVKEDLKKTSPSPVLRKDFVLKNKVASARAYVTSKGLYELYINGNKVGDQVLTPGWTSYNTQTQYQTYDVTDLLEKGDNAIGAQLGDGWYRGFLAWQDQRNVYGEKLGLIAQIKVVYKDGSTETIITDGSWKSTTGPILASDLYMGETYDARKEMPGWCKAGYNDASWGGVTVGNHTKSILVAPAGPAIRKVEELKPIEKIITPEGDVVFDMGQNMVGWIRFKVQGPAGTTIKIRHAEVLDKEGNFYTENLRRATQLIQYTLKGDGVEVFEPHFTFQGFRYIDVDGWPGEPTLEDFTGVVVHSDYEMTGGFECSNPLLNQLQHNIIWGQHGNFVDVPTDCPQRDERLGWTGDAQVFAPTACYNSNVAGFYTKWMDDFNADQKSGGSIPHVIPNVLNRTDPIRDAGACGWADAAVIVPWTVYQYYDDTRILEQQYESMKKWIGYMEDKAGDTFLYNTGQHFGDWLSYNTTSSDYPGAYTDKDFLATAYFAHSTELMSKIAKILGKDQDAQKYQALLQNIKKAFVKEFITPEARLSPNTQTAYAVAFDFGLIPDDMKEQAAERLADDIKKFGHITTGFLGASPITHVLSDNGDIDLAYMLLNRKKYPSWLYPVTKGATTIWERWDGIKPDGSFQNKGMNSFNHYAYGAIGNWMYRVITGVNIDPQNPGYKHIIIKPRPGGELTSAKTWHKSLYGMIKSGWEISGNAITVNIEIPANTTADVCLPGAELAGVMESGKPLEKAKGILETKQMDGNGKLVLGSGSYSFTYTMK